MSKSHHASARAYAWSPLLLGTEGLRGPARLAWSEPHPSLGRVGLLPQEAELIRNIQELLRRTIMQAVNQIRWVFCPLDPGRAFGDLALSLEQGSCLPRS